jgi:KaiC/GvpD/RAD55 family RecA-like ATPase
MSLAEWPATTCLIGEFPSKDDADNPILMAADGVISLRQVVDRGTSSRTLQVLKMRRQKALPGLHTLRIAAH